MDQNTELQRRLAPLAVSKHEREVLKLLVQGTSNQEIADSLCISPQTAANLVYNIMNTLGLDSPTNEAMWAVRQGML